MYIQYVDEINVLQNNMDVTGEDQTWRDINSNKNKVVINYDNKGENEYKKVEDKIETKVIDEEKQRELFNGDQINRSSLNGVSHINNENENENKKVENQTETNKVIKKPEPIQREIVNKNEGDQINCCPLNGIGCNCDKSENKFENKSENKFDNKDDKKDNCIREIEMNKSGSEEVFITQNNDKDFIEEIELYEDKEVNDQVADEATSVNNTESDESDNIGENEHVTDKNVEEILVDANTPTPTLIKISDDLKNTYTSL